MSFDLALTDFTPEEELAFAAIFREQKKEKERFQQMFPPARDVKFLWHKLHPDIFLQNGAAKTTLEEYDAICAKTLQDREWTPIYFHTMGLNAAIRDHNLPLMDHIIAIDKAVLSRQVFESVPPPFHNILRHCNNDENYAVAQAQKLIHFGANVNITSPRNLHSMMIPPPPQILTPVHYALSHRMAKLSKLLIRNGALLPHVLSPHDRYFFHQMRVEINHENKEITTAIDKLQILPLPIANVITEYVNEYPEDLEPAQPAAAPEELKPQIPEPPDSNCTCIIS